MNVKPDFDSISNKNSVMVFQIANLIFKNTDIIILTVFFGLKIVSIYAMYNLIFTMIDVAVQTINGSVTSALGLIYNESKMKYLKFYDLYEVYFMSTVFSLFSVTYILILPFMELYTAGITDANYIDYFLPIFFVSIKLLSCREYL